MDLTAWKTLLKKTLTGERFNHSLGVQEASLKLARYYDVDPLKAETAGLLHDFGKQFSPGELLQKARELGIAVHPVEKISPDLLHGPVGAELLKRDYGLEDSEIIEAIRFHTTGRSRMGDLSRIVFLADFIEENRSFPGVREIREISQRNLREALQKTLDHTIRFVLDRGLPLHPYSVDFRNTILQERKEKPED